MVMGKKKVGLALGGGGARGFAHIGVLKVLVENDIEIDVIAGTSMGSIVGAVYAAGVSVAELEERALAFLRSKEFTDSPLSAIVPSVGGAKVSWWQRLEHFTKEKNLWARAFFKPGAIRCEEMLPLIKALVPDILIEEMPLPFRAVASDLVTGERVVFDKGSLHQALLASCAIPGAIEPIKSKDMLLVDGGVLSLVPVYAAYEAGAQFVIAVSVDLGIGYWMGVKTALDTFLRVGNIASENLKKQEMKAANVIIRPNVGSSHWADFSRVEELIVAGEEATKKLLPSIATALPLYQRLFRWLSKGEIR